MKKPVYKELVAASSRPMVLSILAGGESYGYEIIKQVKLLSGGQLEWSDGMLYPVLHRLERDGLIAGRWELTDEGRRRKYYRLTARGKKQLTRDRKSWHAVYGALETSWGGSQAMVALLMLVALPAVPIGSSASQAPAIAIDSTGVEVVTSDPLGSDATCTLGEEPIFRVGDSEDEEEEWFSQVRGVARLSDGSVAVVDRTSAEVRIFDRTGRHLRSMGRSGDGPGEFRDPWKLWVLPGDTLWVGDYRPWRYNVFTSDGEWVRTVPMSPPYPNPSRGGGVLDNGSSMNTVDERHRRGDFSRPDIRVVEAHGADGDRLGALTRLPNRYLGQTREAKALNFWMGRLFDASPMVDAGGRTIVLAHGRDPEVRILDEEFRLRRIIRWSEPARQVTAADVRAWREDFIESRGGRNSPDWGRFDDPVVDPERPVAEVFPAMSSVMIGRDGRVWVWPYRRPRAEPRGWMVFEPDGDFLCHLRIDHAGLTGYEMGADYYLGVHTGELGIQTVMMYRLNLPGDATP